MTELSGIEVFRIKEKECYGEWARYTLKMVALTVSRLNRVPVIQYEGEELVLYAVRPSTIAKSAALKAVGVEVET